jgi:hypothetical protein
MNILMSFISQFQGMIWQKQRSSWWHDTYGSVTIYSVCIMSSGIMDSVRGVSEGINSEETTSCEDC